MGGWWRADGARWQFEHNEKRKREGKAKMAAWQEEKARRKAVREEAGKENLQYIVRCEFEITDRLRRQAELDDLIDAVKHNGRSIYCVPSSWTITVPSKLGTLAPPCREAAAMINAPLFCAPHWHHPGSCLARLLKLVTVHADGE